MRKLVTVMAAVMVATLLQVGASVPAHAISDEEYNTLDHVDIHSYPVPDPDVYDDGFMPLAGTDCKKHSKGHQVDGYNGYGDILWSFGSYLQDCTKNGKVVHKKWGACWGWTSNDIRNLWNFKGCEIEDQSNQTLPRAYIWRQWRGHFKMCLVWYCKTKDPWVYIGGRGDGTFGVNGGAG